MAEQQQSPEPAVPLSSLLTALQDAGEADEAVTQLERISAALFNNSMAKQAAGDAGFLAVCVAVLAKFPASSKIRLGAAKAIRNCCFKHGQNRERAREAKALDAVVSLIAAAEAEEDVVHEGIWALSTICNNDAENTKRAGELGAKAKVEAAMARWPACGGIQKKGLFLTMGVLS